MDYDLQANVLPKAGTAAAVALDGSVATAAIDTRNFGSLTFIVNTTNLIAYSAVAWAMTHSDDGVTYAAVPANDILVSNPANLADTAKVFHAGYRGKKRYVKANPVCTGAGTGQVVALLGHPDSAPVFQAGQFDAWNGPAA